MISFVLDEYNIVFTVDQGTNHIRTNKLRQCAQRNVKKCFSFSFQLISRATENKMYFFVTHLIFVEFRGFSEQFYYYTSTLLQKIVLYNKNGPPCSFVCKSKNDASLLEVALCQDVLMGMIVYVFSQCCYNFLLENEVALHLNLLH